MIRAPLHTAGEATLPFLLTESNTLKMKEFWAFFSVRLNPLLEGLSEKSYFPLLQTVIMVYNAEKIEVDLFT